MSEPRAWVKLESLGDGGSRFVVSPLGRGMGTTLGNSLRRVLLSGLKGAAITSVRIEGVTHEFSTIPGVVEDVLDIICNIKGIVFKLHSEGPKELALTFSGAGAILAKDIKLDSDVEIVNPDHHIAQLSQSRKLTMNFVVESGVGYASVSANRHDDQDIHVIAIDSSFSPVVSVNHTVENIRVGKELDYESLKLDVWTNGSLSAEEAVRQSSFILVEHLNLFGGELNQKPTLLEEPVQGEVKTINRDSSANLTIDDLELSARSSNCLKRAGIETVDQLISKELTELIKIKNFGRKSADEINSKLKQYGLALQGSLDEILEKEEVFQ